MARSKKRREPKAKKKAKARRLGRSRKASARNPAPKEAETRKGGEKTQKRSPQHRPEKLYRYMSLAGQRREWARQLLVENKAYFARPYEFNDPYECRPHFTERGPSALKEDWAKAEKEYAATDNPSVPPPFVRVSSDATARHRLEVEVRQELAFLSLTTIFDSLPMWSYYADGHRGICVEFDVDGLAEGKWFCAARSIPTPHLAPVQYAQQPHTVDGARPTAEDWQQSVFVKPAAYQAEHEWRMVADTVMCGGSRLLIVPGKAITGILLGCEVPRGDCEMVQTWIVDRRAAEFARARDRNELAVIEYLQAKSGTRNPDSFELVFAPLAGR